MSLSLPVATSLTARDINRRTVFWIVRERQPLSRADVARMTGLQRSTVSSIADQLIDEGWLREGGATRLPRGRRPIRLHVNDDGGPPIVAVDIRPAITTVALANLQGRFEVQHTFSTPSEPAPLLRLIEEKVELIRAGRKGPFAGIGVSLPGRVDTATGRLAIAPNLGWQNVDIAGPLGRSTGLQVSCENAANACSLAEIHFSKPNTSAGDLVAVTVSEGVGTGVVIGGRLLGGLAAEFGHTTIETEGLLCRCGNRGCWEMYASNNAALRYMAESLEAGSASRKQTGTRKGPAPPDPTLEDYQALLALAAKADPHATKALDKQAKFLGIGIANLIRGFTPSRVVIVGEITREWHRVRSVIEAELALRLPPNTVRPILSPADQALHPRVRGAAALVIESKFGMMASMA